LSHIRVDVKGAVGTITIGRPDRFNSLDVETARDLRKAGIQLARDNNVRAVVLRGTQKSFCSGADLKYINAGGDAADVNYLTGQPDNRTTGQLEEPVPLLQRPPACDTARCSRSSSSLLRAPRIP
jgi:enoyl-CoA hydratase/carnithine racemase